MPLQVTAESGHGRITFYDRCGFESRWVWAFVDFGPKRAFGCVVKPKGQRAAQGVSGLMEPNIGRAPGGLQWPKTNFEGRRPLFLRDNLSNSALMKPNTCPTKIVRVLFHRPNSYKQEQDKQIQMQKTRTVRCCVGRAMNHRVARAHTRTRAKQTFSTEKKQNTRVPRVPSSETHTQGWFWSFRDHVRVMSDFK